MDRDPPKTRTENKKNKKRQNGKYSSVHIRKQLDILEKHKDNKDNKKQ